MNYKGRLVFELVEVTEKIMKLDNYMNCPREITKDEQDLLNRQMEFMQGYKETLIQRIILIIGGKDE